MEDKDGELDRCSLRCIDVDHDERSDYITFFTDDTHCNRVGTFYPESDEPFDLIANCSSFCQFSNMDQFGGPWIPAIQFQNTVRIVRPWIPAFLYKDSDQFSGH